MNARGRPKPEPRHRRQGGHREEAWGVGAGKNPCEERWDFFNSGRYSRSLAIGVTMMVQCFESSQALGIADMADMLALGRSTTHRYAATLQALGWLEQTQEHKYRLAHRAASPGMAVLGEVALMSGSEPVLRDLRTQTGHTASLGVLDGTRVTYVRRLLSHRKGQYEADSELRAGAHVPLHCTALGLALLGSLDDDELRDVLAGLELTRHTRRTVTSKRRLQTQIVQARNDGLAVSDREFIGSECSLAAAVPERAGEWRLAVELNAPAASSSVDALLGFAGRLVRDAAMQIGARLTPLALGPACTQSAGK